ncbi:MAG: response regulator transcription factor [Vogesella sp.]|uniref:response regulator transcription factor n=1 Tax=Vogesella sp. TaxID=1904252 RepID=UPI00391B99BE
MVTRNNPLNVVVVEDHDVLREVTMEALRVQGYHVYGVDCAEALGDLAVQPDLFIIDLNLPGEDGISLARRLRSSQPEVGIIMTTARNSIAARVEGYASGADIYLTKPCSLEELLAAVRSLARRLHESREAARTWWLHSDQQQLSGPAGVVPLTASEFALLAGLCRAPGRQLETWQMIELLGKRLEDYSKANLEVQLVRLRKKLVQAGCDSSALKAVRGQGYQLAVALAIQ